MLYEVASVLGISFGLLVLTRNGKNLALKVIFVFVFSFSLRLAVAFFNHV